MRTQRDFFKLKLGDILWFFFRFLRKRSDEVKKFIQN